MDEKLRILLCEDDENLGMLLREYLHPGAQIRDNALSKARYEFRWRDQFHLSLDPDRALEYFNEGRHTDGEYCTMCGPNFCAMKLSRDLKNVGN